MFQFTGEWKQIYEDKSVVLRNKNAQPFGRQQTRLRWAFFIGCHFDVSAKIIGRVRINYSSYAYNLNRNLETNYNCLLINLMFLLNRPCLNTF
jgi:hypothetical protein